MELRLFSDRISHPCRACLLMLGSLEKPFHEVKLNLLRGDHFKREEVRPWLKVPVLQVKFSEPQKPDFFIGQSTSILRFLAMTSSDGKSDERIDWYPTDLQDRIKIDEFFDFWQSSMNPALIRASQQNHFYKILLKKEKKDEKLVQEFWTEYVKSHQLFKNYFLSGKNFLTENGKLSIADLIAVTTFEHTKNIEPDFVDQDSSIVDYIERCREMFPDYDVVHEECRNVKQTLKNMNML